MKRYLFALLPILIVITGCSRGEDGTREEPAPLIKGVVVGRIEPVEVDDFYETSGTVKAKTISTVSSRVMGEVLSIHVKEGDRVRKGSLLVKIDDGDLHQRLKSAEHGYREAKRALEIANKEMELADRTYKRYKGLYDEKVITEQEFDEISTKREIARKDYERAGAGLDRAKAMLDEMRVAIRFTDIRAPFSGTITEKMVEVGMMARPGTPLLKIEDNSHFLVEADVDESVFRAVNKGDRVRARIDSMDKDIYGTISEIFPTIDPNSRTFRVKVSLKHRSLRTGLFARVYVPTGRKQVIMVPSSSVVKRGDLTGVYGVDDKGVVRYRLIRTGRVYKDGVEVLSGISKGDRIVVSGLDKVIEGGIVEE